MGNTTTRQGTNVLVVDDEESQRDPLAKMISAWGFNVETASDGQEALDRLGGFSANVIVTDLMMPRMDGFALTEAIRGAPRLAELPVILFSSRASETDRARGAEVGADAYLVKGDFDQKDLLETISQLL